MCRWFNQLNKNFNVNGHPSIFYKPIGACKTMGLTGEIAKDKLLANLHSENKAYIYHCYNHYCCPIGYEKEPLDHTKIYSVEDQDYVDWIFVADTSRKYPSIHCVKWEDINKDLNTKSPEFLNIRHLEKGLQARKNSLNSESTKVKRSDKNLHCLIQFERTVESLNFDSSPHEDFDGNESEKD